MHLLASAGVLGRPEEFFNYDPNALPVWMEAKKPRGINEYIDQIRRIYQSGNGVFGMEVSFPQLEMLTQLVTIRELFDSLPVWFYLRRQNLLGQAISLYLASISGFWHSYQKSPEKMAAMRSVPYDAEGIRKMIEEILRHESRFETFFNNQNIEPVRLYYEGVIADSARTLRLFGNVLRVEFDQNTDSTGLDTQMSTSRNREWQEAFRTSEAEYLSGVDARRPPLAPLGACR
jgi:LPS sulfotransferase NodH